MRNSSWMIKGVEVGDNVLQHGKDYVEGVFTVRDIDDNYVELEDGSLWHKLTGRKKDLEKQVNYYGPWIAILKT